MATTIIYSFNCKNEELPIICRYALSMLQRDIHEFTAFSPIFNQTYIDNFAAQIDQIDELILPKLETEELKKITRRLYTTMDGLMDPLTRLRGYLQLAQYTVGMSAKDFGITLLEQKIRARDAEGVRQNLLLVNANLFTWQSQLATVGLDSKVTQPLTAAVLSITEDNQQQFDIQNKRKDTVQTNSNMLNDLYTRLMEILNAGKVLFKHANPMKAKEYTFNNLKNHVRVTTKSTPEKEKLMPEVQK